jgi:glyoxylase-like metal-dependent hydrolase (beta-lactamase superfamily II)
MDKCHNRLNIRYRRGLWHDVKIRTFRFNPSKYGPQKAAFDLLGDESMMLIHSPGHSAGMTALLVKANDKFVLLTGDSAYAKKSWEQMVSPGITPDAKKAMESLAWVKTMSWQPGCVQILATHDPAVTPHTIEL